MLLENPYRYGAYHFTIETLMQMGVNEPDKFSAFTERLRKVWTKADAEGWSAFEKREARNEATAKDLDGRIFQNCRVLQRTKAYGKPLLRAGAVIDLTRDDRGVLFICLNTKSRKPQKPGRAAQAPKPESKPAKRKAKSIRKPTGGKKTPQKRSGKAPEPTGTPSASQESTKTITDEPAKAE